MPAFGARFLGKGQVQLELLGKGLGGVLGEVLVKEALPQAVKILTRVAAKFVDLSLCFALATVLPTWVGFPLALAYSLLADCFRYRGLPGVSLGKRFVHLRVIRVEGGGSIRPWDSVVRNSPFGLLMFFAIHPVLGWLFLILVGIPLIAVELFFMARSSRRQRIGDLMADTVVVHVESLSEEKPVSP